MSLSPSQIAAIEDAINRLAAESILAQVGSDECLVPSYSLLSDLREKCAPEPQLAEPIGAVLGQLEKLLDSAQPFDIEALSRLRSLVDWLVAAISAVRVGNRPPTMGEKGPQRTVEAAAPGEDRDTLLVLDLGENRELLTEFYAETVDHLQQIEAALLALDQEPDNPEALNSIFRSFHTIKGNAGFLGLVPMRTLAHEVESLLDRARNHELRLNAAIITEILRSRDALQALTQQVAVALEKGELPAEIVPVVHLISAVRTFAVSDGSAPGPVEQPALVPVSSPEHVVEPAATAPMEPAVSASVAPAEPEPRASEPATESVAPATVESESPAPRRVKQSPDAEGKSSSSVAKIGANGTVRVNIDKLDSLMDVVGELVIVQSQLIESSRGEGTDNGTLQRNVGQLSRITKELQSTAMSLRMIPIKPMFQKMERLARDLARDFGKKVAFVTSGEDTELDRTVVEEIGDPLVHMVRNALDHGLEPPELRRQSGKPDTGTLHLKAYHQGSNIVIELQDDGRGIDPDRIHRKAVEKGMFAAGTLLSREEILALIFAPGFSTAEKVTSVSGRGVGMDVVKRNIEKLRGKIEIVSEVGHGSTFKIKLPLTMAIIDGLVVRVGEDRFILPSTSVQMALRPKRDQITTVHGKGEILDLRGRFVPIHRLNRRFGIPGEASDPWEGIVVILENSGKISALLVDEMVSKQEVVIKNLGAFMQNLPGIAGGAILGDGNIALILDPGSLLNAA